jgi:methionine biosynthesis protein MetW
MNKPVELIDLKTVKLEYRVILNLIPEGSSVLDLGCGDGALLHLLETQKNVKGSGIEIDEQAVRKCAALGISVSQQDIESGLSDYGDKSFDFVILNQSLQQVVKLEQVLKETMRVGREVIIGFPNFCYYKSRMQLFFKGRTPVTPSLPNMWYDTPNLHFLSINDFIDYCKKRNFRVKKTVCVNENRVIRLLSNLLAQTGIFLLAGNEKLSGDGVKSKSDIGVII